MSILKPTTVVSLWVLVPWGQFSRRSSQQSRHAGAGGGHGHGRAGAKGECPKGYYVTGGGAYNGAITEIASSPRPDLRGSFVDGTNIDRQNRTFQQRADAACVKGSPTVSVGRAAHRSLLQHVQADVAARRGNQRLALRG